MATLMQARDFGEKFKQNIHLAFHIGSHRNTRNRRSETSQVYRFSSARLLKVLLVRPYGTKPQNRISFVLLSNIHR